MFQVSIFYHCRQHLLFPLQRQIRVARRRVGGRCIRDSGEENGFAVGQLLRFFPEVAKRRFFQSIVAIPEIDGIDVARYVRYKLGDWSSLIIFVTNFSKYRNKILTSRLDVLDYIKKSKRGYEELEEVIAIVLSKYRSTDSCLTFEKDYSVFKIKYRDIIFIERELNSKCCILYTTSGEYRITKSLAEIEELLDNRFLRTHRSAIINVDKIIEYNVKTNTVIFSTGESTDLVARSKRKELKERVLSYN